MSKLRRRRLYPKSRSSIGSGRLWQLMHKHKNKCAYCGRLCCREKGRGNTATIDHVVPISYGGDNRKSNLTLACWRCNRWKGATSYADFLRLLTDIEQGDYPIYEPGYQATA